MRHKGPMSAHGRRKYSSVKRLFCGIRRCPSAATLVNGQDLSQSSHNEAVEAFRAAKEPIIVEVLRRGSKASSLHSSGSSSSCHSSGGGDSSCTAGAGGCPRRCAAMVSIGTQTEEDLYCFSRPPTPPQGYFPIVNGLYQPSSRRPVAFSPSQDMGLTDIEMSGTLDVDDPYFDDRNYEMVYEEVVLRRNSSLEKLGLTLCYGSLEDEMTDIFISEVDPSSVAGKDGRIREGDQIVQINGVDVRSRSEAISLFSGHSNDIALTVARPQLQCDDGFLEEPNMVLDDLHMDLLEKQHHDNMSFMASMLARRHQDEEGGTTDTATTENSSHKHEKDSGVGRTDESTRNDESSEQETFDSESIICPPPPLPAKLRLQSQPEAHYMSTDVTSDIMCSRFRNMLNKRCASAGNSPRRGDGSRNSSEGSLERELAVLNREMEDIQVECQDLVDNHTQRLGLADSLLQRSPRVVPRMGTRPAYAKQELGNQWAGKEGVTTPNGRKSGSSPSHISPPSPANNHLNHVPPGYSTAMSISSVGSSKNNHNNNLQPYYPPAVTSSVSLSVTAAMLSSCRGNNLGTMSSEFNSLNSHTNTSSSNTSSSNTHDREAWTTTSAYNTGESCRSTPLMTLELTPADHEYAEPGLSGSMLCLAATPSTISSGGTAIPSSDTEKTTQTPTKSRDYSSEDSGHGKQKKQRNSSTNSGQQTVKAMNIADSVKGNLTNPAEFESLQDLYLRCADVMYTNRANLEHTIAVQQKLFQQQLEQQASKRGLAQSPGHSTGSGNDITVAEVSPAKGSPGQTAPSDSGQMEWVVKRRPDGTRYITRRPVRSKMLKERAKKINEERCGLTTDDDAMSEMKTGRYWSKEDRKRHLEKAKDYKKRKELMVKVKMDTLKETEEKKEVNIVELSHRKMMKHKGKKVFDNFTTVKEMLAHGNKATDGKTYNPLLSVTTV